MPRISAPSDKGSDGVAKKSFIESGTLDADVKRKFPRELLFLMRRQAVDLLLGNSYDPQGRSTLKFIKSIVEDRKDLEQLKKGMKGLVMKVKP